MPYLCIDRHNHKYYKPINPYCKGVRGNWGNVFLIGAGTLLREICLHATALALRSNAAVLGSALLTLALTSAGVFEGSLSKDISRRSCALTNGNILQLGGADACRLIVVQRAARRRQTSCLMLDSMRIGSLTPVSLGNERIPCDFSRVLVQPILKNNYYSIYFIFRLV